MAVNLEQNLPSITQIAKIAPKTIPQKTDDLPNQQQIETTYYGKQLSFSQLAPKAPMINDRKAQEWSYILIPGNGFDPADIRPLNDPLKILVQSTGSNATDNNTMTIDNTLDKGMTDTSATPLITKTVEAIHEEIVSSVVNRMEWMGEKPYPEDGKIFLLDFQALSQEVLERIRRTSAENSEEMHDTPGETLRNIYEARNDIDSLPISDVTKEALRLIIAELTDDNGNYDKGKSDTFLEMLLNYSANENDFGKTNGKPDAALWKTGSMKVGFKMVNNELEIVKPKLLSVVDMILSVENDQRTLVLTFKADGVTYDIAYNIADLEDVIESAGDEENPQLRINGEKVSVGDKTIIEYLETECNISPKDMKSKFENVKAVKYLDNSKLGRNNISLTYLNRLEFVARIGIRDDFTFTDEDNRTYTFQYVSNAATINNKEGWLYVVTAKGSTAEQLQVFMSKIEKVNDVPLISGGGLVIQKNWAVQDDRGTLWVRADQSTLGIVWSDVRNRQSPFLFGR
jgi:hypothetical protein